MSQCTFSCSCWCVACEAESFLSSDLLCLTFIDVSEYRAVGAKGSERATMCSNAVAHPSAALLTQSF